MVTAYAGSPFGGCNVGFIGHKDGDDYMVTALHCVGHETQVGDVVGDGWTEYGEVTHVPTRKPSIVPGIDYIMDGDYVVVRLNDDVEVTDEIDRIWDGRMIDPAYSPSQGEELVKEGDATGVTRGTCVATSTTILSPGSLSNLGGTIELQNQVAVSTSVWPGDSGGPIMKESGNDYYPVGVLHGGVPEFSMVGTRIDHIEEVSGVDFGAPKDPEEPEPDPDPPDEEPPETEPPDEDGPSFNRSRVLGAGLSVAFGTTAVYLG